MQILGQILSGVGGLGMLVCFILIVVQIFQHGETTMGIVCLVLWCCFGLGFLVTFIYGWVKHRDWRITNIMYVYTASAILVIVGNVIHPVDVGSLRSISGF
jgi:hypothetical protein